MRRLFRTFDPRTGIGVNINWIRCVAVCLIPSSSWVVSRRSLCGVSSLAKGLSEEIGRVNGRVAGSSVKLAGVALFITLAVSNFIGLCPFVFTSTRHIRFTFPLRIMLWSGIMGFRLVKNFSSVLAHLVPEGTPVALVPFMVCIEIISSLMRPMTLAVRLAANIIAGHLLLVLCSTPACSASALALSIIWVAILLLVILEIGVALIQRYVFTRLNSLYVSEVNNPTL